MDWTGETREELLDLTRAHGYEISEPQLARWHRAGLLPRPKQRSLGKGHGTRTVYPSGTGEQLLALCEIHANERRLVYVAWRLWWAGYEVSLNPIREFLGGLAQEWDRCIQDLTDPETGGMSESAIELLEQAPTRRYSLKPLRQARKRVGSDRFEILMVMMFNLASGQFAGFSEDPAGDPREDEGHIFERGFGLDRGSVARGRNAGAKQANELEATLTKASGLFGEHLFSGILEAAGDEDLLESRDWGRSMVTGMELIGVLARQEPNSEAAKFMAMGDAFQEMGPQEQAVLVFSLLMWRSWGPAEIREKMDFYHRDVQEIVSRLRELG